MADGATATVGSARTLRRICMYTHIKSVQILISLLKQYNIRHLVISPGTRNTALAHSVETDNFFTCYSIVDERSAGYFALGISEALNVPVCVSCTAATATCNYLPAMKQAYERGVQLVALTADQDPYGMFHMEDQCIDQVDMFHGYVKCAVDIPMVRDDRDYWYCNRRINEALMALDTGRKGPVQINYHMSYGLDEISTFDVEDLPQTRKIQRHTESDDLIAIAAQLKEKKRILIVGGSDYDASGRLKQALAEFTERYDGVAICDNYANVYTSHPRVLNPRMLGDTITRGQVRNLKPDLVLSFGNVYYSTVKYFLPQYAGMVEHWQIAQDGVINDGYHCLTKVFCTRAEEFFEKMNSLSDRRSDGAYAELWQKRMEMVQEPDLGFTNFYAIKNLCHQLPQNAVLHTSVLDSIRLSNYVDMPSSVRCFANIGADGIDGALSSFLGQAAGESELAFLIIGDLSILYDMNALLQAIPSNVRIMVVNNYAGAEFHKNFGLKRIPTINQLVAAGHSVKIEKCCINGQFDYLSAKNQQELECALIDFCTPGERPILLEVFTDAATDAATLKKYWQINHTDEPAGKRSLRGLAVGAVNKILPPKVKNKLRKVYDVLRS